MIITEERERELTATDGVSRSPMLLDGWLEFNQSVWGVNSLRVRLAARESGTPAAETVHYLNGTGNIVRPPLTPYIPVVFESTPTESRARLDRQWHQVGHLLAEDMRERRLVHMLPLSIDVQDVRPWQWAGFQTSVNYTHYLDLPTVCLLFRHRRAGQQLGRAAPAGSRRGQGESVIASRATLLELPKEQQLTHRAHHTNEFEGHGLR